MNSRGFYNYLDKINFVELSKIYQAHNTYFSSQGWDRGKLRTKWFSYCQELIDDMSENNATYEEMERAIIFAYVVLDAEKCRLSIIKAYDDLCIVELYKRYVLGEKDIYAYAGLEGGD